MYRMCDAIREEEKKKEEISEKNMSRTNERFFDTCDRLRESSEFEPARTTPTPTTAQNDSDKALLEILGLSNTTTTNTRAKALFKF